jgi:hypothetical protein
LASAIAGLTSSPNDARINASTVVANLVWTIEDSSANGSSTASPAAATTGVCATAEIASEGVPSGSADRARTTSVVVPEREIATTRS